MFLGGVEVLVIFVLGILGLLATLTILYWVIRLAVRHGSVDASHSLEATDVRSRLGVGDERSPNSRG